MAQKSGVVTGNDVIWEVVTTVIQVTLAVCYLGVGAIMSFLGLAAVGGNPAEERDAALTAVILYNLQIWLPVLVCVFLSWWLHFAKKWRVIALLVLVLPLVIGAVVMEVPLEGPVIWVAVFFLILLFWRWMTVVGSASIEDDPE